MFPIPEQPKRTKKSHKYAHAFRDKNTFDLDIGRFVKTVFVCFLIVCLFCYLINFLSIATSFCQPGLAPGRFTQMNVAVGAHDDGLGVRKDGRNLKAAGTLNIHKIGIGRLYQTL